MARLDSPLQTIKQLELDLRQRVEDARGKSEVITHAAREEARQSVALADREGRAEAEASHYREIELAHQEAETIVSDAQAEAAAIRRRSLLRMDDVAGRIVELVLPKTQITK